MRDEVEKLIVDWLKSDNENATYLADQIMRLYNVSNRFFESALLILIFIGVLILLSYAT